MLSEEKRIRRNAYQREWARRNPDKIKASYEKRKAEGYYRKWASGPKGVARRKAVYAEKTAWLAQIKLDSGCVDCGYRKDHRALEFDHVRGVKEFNLSQSTWHSRDRTEAEIAKCEVVCANCHRIRTCERGQHRSWEKHAVCA